MNSETSNSEVSSESPSETEQAYEMSSEEAMETPAAAEAPYREETGRKSNPQEASRAEDLAIDEASDWVMPAMVVPSAERVNPRPGVEPVPPEPVPLESVVAEPAVKENIGEASAVNVPMLSLTRASMARELVTLRRDEGGTASYERVTGKVLGRPWRRTTLFFTSTKANEGATAVAVNVATMLSRNTESVLLVELQLTEPSLWALLGRPPVGAGLEEALRGHVRFRECVYRIEGEKLDVLPVKQAMSVEEADHLSGALNDFLEWAEERFEWLVVDCPPVLAGSWTRWFELNADPVVLVAGTARTKKYELRKVLQRLGDRLAGTILNESEPVQKAS